MAFTNNPDIKAELGRCAAIEAAGELSWIRSRDSYETQHKQIRHQSSFNYFNLHYITTMEKPFIFFPLGIFVSLSSKFLMASSSLLFAMSIINMIQIIYKLNATPFAFRGLVMGFPLWEEGLGKEARWWGGFCIRFLWGNSHNLSWRGEGGGRNWVAFNFWGVEYGGP